MRKGEVDEKAEKLKKEKGSRLLRKKEGKQRKQMAVSCILLKLFQSQKKINKFFTPMAARRSGVEEDAALLEAASSAYSSPRKHTDLMRFQ
jgi:hypothetical protein